MKKLISIFIVITLALMGCSGNSEPSWTDAYYYAETSVKEHIKSPSTAEFPSISEQESHTTKISETEYLIESWVDSQNSFGAMLRQHFTATVTFTGEKASVKLDWN